MSCRLEATNSERLDRAAILAGNGNCTLVGWMYFPAFQGGNSGICNLYSATDFTGVSLWVTSGGVLTLYEHNGAGSTTGSTLSTATWYWIWLTWTGSTFQVFLDGGTSADITSGGGSKLANGTNDVDLSLAYRQNYSTKEAYSDIRLQAWHLWDAAKAASNGNTQKVQTAAYTNTDLVSSYSLATGTDIDDDFGANDLTATGTLSTEADPPLLDPATGRIMSSLARHGGLAGVGGIAGYGGGLAG